MIEIETDENIGLLVEWHCEIMRTTENIAFQKKGETIGIADNIALLMNDLVNPLD